MKLAITLAACVAMSWSSNAMAQLPSVALCGVPVAACETTDVQVKLMATGRFSAVDILDVKTATPTLATLNAYDAVMTWTNADYFDRTTLGNNMADFVDAGGGVVVTAFTNAAGIGGRFLGGRWATGGYTVISPISNFHSAAAFLGAVAQPTHPVMVGVNTFTATYAARPTTTNLDQGTILASWSDGSIFAAVGNTNNRVDLGMFPPSSDCIHPYWDATGDGTVLMANALVFVAGAVTGASSFCDPADNNSTGQPTTLTGVFTSPSGTGLHLESNQGPPGEFGYFLIGTGVSEPGLALGSGHFCLAVGLNEQFGRYNTGSNPALNSLGQFDASGTLVNMVGTSSVGTGFDVPTIIPITGSPTIQAGTTWHFQVWHREALGDSNFSNGLSMTF